MIELLNIPLTLLYVLFYNFIRRTNPRSKPTAAYISISDWFTFEVDDDQIQEDLLQIKVFDKDTVTANDPIGKVCAFNFPNDVSNLSQFVLQLLQRLSFEFEFLLLTSDLPSLKTTSCGSGNYGGMAPVMFGMF